MTGQQLKDSILQMAIQGKLVPQDPRDEPASALLDKIRKEKARLVKDKIISKNALKEEPFLEENMLFDIPTTWEWCKLGWVGNWGAGATPAKGKPEYYSNGNIPWIRTGELNNGIVYDSEIKVTQRAMQECSLRECHIGDVLIAMYGATIGKVAIAGIDLTTNQACCACTPYLVYNKYMFYYLMANKNRFVKLGEGGAQPNISREKIISFPFSLPPLSEQRRIVAKIEELMPIIERYGKSQEDLDKLNASLPDKLRQSILQEAIQGHLVPQDPHDEPASALLDKIRKEKARLVKEGKLKKKDLEETPISPDEIPFDIPEGWEWCRLTDIASNSLGKTLNGGKTTGQIKPYLCTINVYWNNIDLSNLKSTPFSENDCVKYKVSRGDLLICEGGDFGRCAVWDIDKEMYYQNALHRVRFYCDVNPYFYMYFICYCKSAKILDELAKGMTIKHLTQDALYSLIFPLPPLNEQRRIVAKIEELMPKIDRLMR